jgi:prolyl 4-hydroxylase
MKGGFGGSPIPKIPTNTPKGFGSPSIQSAEKKKSFQVESTAQVFVAPIVRDPNTAKTAAIAHIPTINTNYPGLRAVHGDPPVFEIDNAFSEEQCSSFISRAELFGKKVQSQTFKDYAGVKRTSTTWYVPYKHVEELTKLATDLTGIPSTHFEEPQIVRYEMGQQFSWHYDAIPASLNKNGGNRLATLLVYLNSLPSSAGGATMFKDINISVSPITGKALLFFPCFSDGAPDDRTMHCGQICGETKWVAQMWIHESEYTPVSVSRE